MPEPPTASAGPQPKTLAEARTEITRLKKLLSGHGPPNGDKTPPGGKPVPGKVDPQPVPTPTPPIPNVVLNLGAMPPAMFAKFIAERTDRELKALLSHETGKGSKQNEAVVGKLYRELKKRGA